MNSSAASKIALILGLSFALVAVCAFAAPAQDDGESQEMNERPMGADENAASAEGGDFDEMSSRAERSQGAEDSEDMGPASAGSMADSQEEPRGLDSNIANAKVQVSASDMAAAAGHHYHGHGVSGKMEMGAHTEKKGAFGWHAKFPVGGKGRK